MGAGFDKKSNDRASMKKFTTKKDLEAYFSGDILECLYCGRSYKSLGVHLKKIHGKTARDYKKDFNIPYRKGLISSPTKLKLKKAMEERYSSGEIQKLSHSQFEKLVGKSDTSVRKEIQVFMGCSKKLTIQHKNNLKKWWTDERRAEQAEKMKGSTHCIGRKATKETKDNLKKSWTDERRITQAEKMKGNTNSLGFKFPNRKKIIKEI